MENRGKILLVDDNEELLELLGGSLQDEGFEVKLAKNGAEALKILEEEDFDLILTDVVMHNVSGKELLEKVQKTKDYISVILMTAYANIDDAVACMKDGAFHYLPKPVRLDEPKVMKLIEEAIEKTRLKKENKLLKERLKQLEESKILSIITVNHSMKNLLKNLKKVALFDYPVVITGESGTGKELFARAIHELSPRKDKPFIAINCASISPDIMEAEFFGYKKGAFTGADKDKKGVIEEADGGTLFLDEIGEMPLDIQSKFLRFLQEKKIRRIGEAVEKPIDVRIISATNRNLEDLVKEGKFRQDLYFRISSVKIHIPPLRERRDDIPVLIYHFIEKFNKENSKTKIIKGITPEALEILINYDWPGNVREIEGAINNACIFANEYINVKDLPNYIISNSKDEFSFAYNKAKKANEKEFMEKYLRMLLTITKGNITQAAKLAEIERQSLQKLLKKFKVNPEEFRKRK
ncbi:MAG TPA: sigma-54-dependent Fis family transcriptional regulator [Persephonella sp.]|nr:sigma-54-dependent Fis family transcriptional regulator [Hydrogenothermaceae bacterium]HIQ25362.1 sigma-54-dependent Fis family transcriptional regulator [Persephonella sp.]